MRPPRRSATELRAGVCFEHSCSLPCPECDHWTQKDAEARKAEDGGMTQ